MAILIGDKSIFAIEASFEQRVSPLFGNIRIWLSEKYVGAYQDSAPIRVFILGIKRALNLNIDANMGLLLSDESFFRGVLDGTMDGGDRYRLSLGEAFDDFSLVGFRDGDIIQVVWALNGEPFFHYPGYPAGIQSSRIPVEIFKNVIGRFEGDVAGR